MIQWITQVAGRGPSWVSLALPRGRPGIMLPKLDRGSLFGPLARGAYQRIALVSRLEF